jgi:hypothetical protein
MHPHVTNLVIFDQKVFDLFVKPIAAFKKELFINTQKALRQPHRQKSKIKT